MTVVILSMKTNELKEGMYIREVGKTYKSGMAILVSRLNFTADGTLSELHGSEMRKDMSDNEEEHSVEFSGSKEYMLTTMERFYEVPTSELTIESI